MPIRYGVLKAKLVDRLRGTADNPHYQIHALAEDVHYRIAVNVKSQLRPYDLLYCAIEHFAHEETQGLSGLPYGYTPLDSRPGGLALDYIRSNLFDPSSMVPLPFEQPGADNDLNEKMDYYLGKAAASPDAELYAFGDCWGPEDNVPDKVFGFRPGRGVHDIHMNQGNEGKFRKDDGVYQDGALLLRFPSENRWIGVFLAFQSQSWHTDDVTGHAIAGAPPGRPAGPKQPPAAGDKPDPQQPDRTPAAIHVAGAVVQPAETTGQESVTLVNAGDRTVDLDGWSLANKSKKKQRLSGTIEPGQFLTIGLVRSSGGQDFLANQGDLITLLDAAGLKVHGVSYTRSQVKPGWTVLF